MAAEDPGPELGIGSRVTIVTLPRGTTLTAIAAESPRIAVGTMSAGLGTVSPGQTYLDVGQGNRLFNSLYPRPLPPLALVPTGVPARSWAEVLDRATDAPAQIEPGLLGSTLREAGITSAALPEPGQKGLMLIDRMGRLESAVDCELGACPGVTLGRANPSEIPGLISRLAEQDILIAIESPPPLDRTLAIGIAGADFEGTLESPTTRTDGYVVSTDIAPTILEHYGLEIPDEMTGRAIGSVEGRDLEGLNARFERMSEITARRHPVLGVNLIVWVGLTLLAALLFRARGAAVAVRALAVAVAWVPALLLLTAAMAPGLLGERLLVGFGAPLLAFATIAVARRPYGERAGFAAFALAALVSVLATAVDVIAGSPLTALSVIGPNPDAGVRFFGIGNELEAVVGALLALGSGAAVAAVRPADPRRAVAIVAAVAATIAVLVFAPGRFGADVGAAVTFPAGAAGVIVAALGAGRRRILLLAAVPVGTVAALIAVDLAIGGDAHLSRSVLDAGGLEELGQIVERRLRLGARSFTRFFDSTFFAASLVVIVAAVVCRRRIAAWFSGRPAARAGLIGGISAAVVGALANDSGALLLMVGTAYVTALAALAWSAQYFTLESESG